MKPLDAQKSTTGQPIRIAILLASPLTQDIFHRIGMPYLASTFDVAIIDCAHWVRVGMSGLTYNKFDYNNLVTVMGEADFKAAIDKLRPMYAIDFTGSGAHTRTIQNILRQAKTKYVAQRITPSPLPNVLPGSSFTSFTQAVSILRRGYRWMLRAISDKNPLPPDIALLAGSRSKDHWTSSSKVILWTGSTDYFTLKELKQSRSMDGHKTENHKGRYILFIDDCLSLSMDYKITGQSRPIEPDTYFDLLLQTFRNIEKCLSIPIIIAAHPSGKEITNYASLFGGRAVYFNATAELSLDCELALTHYSTAAAYPVLLRKPIIVLNAQSLQNTHPGKFIDNMHRILKCPVLFMDSDISCWENIMTRSRVVDDDAYDDYEKNYIMNGCSSDTNPFQEFVRFATGC